MYEDESVDVRYSNGSQLQLSSCGGEFLLVKATDPTGHPLQARERVRQRTRFTISTYKELMVAALAFRNKYASRPYLPEELIPAEHKKSFCSIDSDIMWPEFSSCEAELGPGGETIIRSEDGQAALMLSASGEEFSIEFPCRLSQTQNRQRSVECFSRDPDGRPACHNWMTRVCKLTDVGAEGLCNSALTDKKMNMSDASSEKRRWKSKDQDLPTELMKVMWCQGVTYRILSGAVSVIEVSPGDGSVIRSNGVLNTYFSHHRPELHSGQGRGFSKPSMLEENLSSPAPGEHHMNLTHRIEHRSDLVAAELEKIKRFNFLLENSQLQRSERGCVEQRGRSEVEETNESVNESSIAEALRRTSKAIQDIDSLVSAATST
ncbi:hypothetical protein F2P81_013562 [Scophthalmus maximus]|uniref:Uncharacterized protein n=1 Tax=Scophthalmus maximus TaxID=52904 RepID=A0A6A4SED1_SCOMX|nr:hypothetical protein F2P81_013562 [Scophthalmus maximus]